MGIRTPPLNPHFTGPASPASEAVQDLNAGLRALVRAMARQAAREALHASTSSSTAVISPKGDLDSEAWS